MKNVNNEAKAEQIKMQEQKEKEKQLKDVQEQALANLEAIRKCERTGFRHLFHGKS